MRTQKTRGINSAPQQNAKIVHAHFTSKQSRRAWLVRAGTANPGEQRKSSRPGEVPSSDYNARRKFNRSCFCVGERRSKFSSTWVASEPLL